MDVFFGAEPARKTFRSFSEHPGQRFFLTRIQLASEPIIQFGFFDQKLDPALGVDLGGYHQVREIDQPTSNFVVSIGTLKCFVVGFFVAFDGVGKCNQGRLTQILGQRFFGKCPSNPAIAIFEGMDADKIEMGHAGAQ